MVGGRWTVDPKERLGKGSFGEVFAGVDTETGAHVAIKREVVSQRPQLIHEYDIYQKLIGVDGFPQIYHFGTEGVYNALVMERLGPSIKDLMRSGESREIPLKTVAFAASQMINRLRVVHERGYVFRDVKPDQFCVGRYGDDLSANPTIFLIDFGLATPYINPEGGRHIKQLKPAKNLPKTGTARYASINVHKGKAHTRRDDIESLGYVLVEMALGKLPWSGVTARDGQLGWRRIGNAKDDSVIADVTDGLPDAFATILETAREMKFPEAPNYDQLSRLFFNLYESLPQPASGLQWSM
ncbi:casein kinase I [Irineochytrium annulatum]|nr:casein kinase I [Irineochytrium annulatum]